MVKPYFLAFSVLAFSVAYAQQPSDPNEVRIYNAYTQLAAQGPTLYRLQGAITVGSANDTITTDMYWSATVSNGQPLTNVELLEYKNNVLQRRLVGDGNTLWIYDISHKTYSAVPYGSFKPVQPANYNVTLAEYLDAAESGPSSYLGRLARQVYGGYAVTYTSWLPGTVPTAANGGVTYSEQKPLQRQIIFALDPNTDALTSITYAASDTVAGLARASNWNITPYTGSVMMNANYQPYAWNMIPGYRPVVFTKPIGK